MSVQTDAIGDLEIRVGQARKEFARFEDYPAKWFQDKTEAEWLASTTPAEQARTTYHEFANARTRLELWEFLLTAARNWQPGDNIVPVETYADPTINDPCRSDTGRGLGYQDV